MIHRHAQRRLLHHNYARTGYYFVTINAFHRCHLFSRIAEGKVVLTDIGEEIKRSWEYIPTSAPYASVDEYVIMPDHFHGILRIDNPEEPSTREPEFTYIPRSLGSIMSTFKMAVSHHVRERHPGQHIWQRRYHDRVIRSEEELERIRTYIRNNPARWAATHPAP